MVLCWIEPLDATDVSVFNAEARPAIDISSDETRDIPLPSYTLTSDPDCGSIVYLPTITSSSDSSFDPLDPADPKAVQVGNLLTLSALSTYPIGTLTVSVAVYYEDLAQLAYDEILFTIEVVDCFNAPISASSVPAFNNQIEVFRFGTTISPKVYEFPTGFTFSGSAGTSICSVTKVRVQCTDPDGSTSIYLGGVTTSDDSS